MQQRKIAEFKLCCFVAILELTIGQIRDEEGDLGQMKLDEMKTWRGHKECNNCSNGARTRCTNQFWQTAPKLPTAPKLQIAQELLQNCKKCKN